MIPGITASVALPATGGGDEKAFSDFKNGVYRLNGSTVTAADLWEQNEEWGPYVEEDAITEDGMGGPISSNGGNTYPVMTSTAYAAVSPGNAGFVAVVTLTIPAAFGQVMQFEFFQLPDYDSDGYARVGTDFIRTRPTSGNSGEIDEDFTAGCMPTGTQRLALRFTQDSVEMLTDTAFSLGSFDTNSNTPANTIALGPSGAGDPVYVESIAFYPVATDLADALAI